MFTDIDVDQDEVVSVFVFDRPIDGGTRMNEL
ncbi:conserved protein of unknown function [Kyrpidia spormannii]|uniref:Uncharacterized protein n=2 Tax=Kyrpidia spormannii TaxID=2055160 RepID=A0ACA8ZA52_9BACL|nr:conserved protein of unknown function [Kyrpidia spormannii]CAB3394174.1 conserved protein of unknown function [Kyrpidia spormannii]